MMSDEDSDRLWEVVKNVLSVVAFVDDNADPLPDAEQMTALEIAWISLAKTRRDKALAFPGGFKEEQDRQLAQLDKVKQLVSGDEPDLELERLTLEEDWDGVMKRLQELWNKLDVEKGGA